MRRTKTNVRPKCSVVSSDSSGYRALCTLLCFYFFVLIIFPLPWVSFLRVTVGCVRSRAKPVVSCVWPRDDSLCGLFGLFGRFGDDLLPPPHHTLLHPASKNASIASCCAG